MIRLFLLDSLKWKKLKDDENEKAGAHVAGPLKAVNKVIVLFK